MKTAIATIAAAASILSLATAEIAFAQSSFQVLRAGDSQLTCEAMTTEINGLNEAIRNKAEQAQRSAQTRATAGRVGRGLLSGLAQGVQMFGMGGLGGGDNPLANIAASAAVSTVSQGLNSAANAPEAPAAAPVEASQDTPEHQRVAHLTGMFGQRC